ncbi:MAG: 3-methyl-2-oxobutanoate dehydrogenase (2-methylpropanoyl-transferring) subunit alpha [Gammaproteobacteria bacterium]|nr:3-methyl-2-oxobutanoate dehydrogenase (2-methylpropanoyl-transferring) subunit alpha [Gammaproteobacteria bacterium]
MATKLHIPHAPFRPGDKPDFSNIKLPKAGELRRPPTRIHANETRDLSFSMIRVLDGDHRAVGEWDPHLDAETLRQGLRHMLLNRVFDDRMYKMQRQGKISFYMRATGEEAVAVAQCMALRPGDMLFPSYRQQGLLIVRGIRLVDMMCQCLSNSRDNLQGRQLPVLYSFKDVNFFTLSGNLGTQFPQAVGWAMAAEYKGTSDVAVSWIGEGSSAEADFHYGLTFASVYRAPVVLNVVNNQWAISTYQNVAGGDQNPFAARAIGYGIPGLRVDGNDFLAVFAATSWAAERARQGAGPTLIELYTYRAAPHSTSDDPGRYRPLDEWQYWPLGDPIDRLKKHMIARGEWSEEQHAELEKELTDHVLASWKEAESYGTLNEGPWPPVSAMFEDVYKDVPPHLIKQKRELLE